jgi:hypothetical protein
MTTHTTARHAADQYLESAVESAPPVKLVRMLVEGAVRFLDRALAPRRRPIAARSCTGRRRRTRS